MKHISSQLLIFIFSLKCFGDAISLSGSPSAFTINSAVAGQQPTAVTNSSTTYSVTTTTVIRVITGKINTAMPANTTLKVTLAAPTGATSLGAVTMTTTAQNLITGIPLATVSSGKTVTYNFSATVSAAQVANATRTLTLTVQ